MHTLQRWDLRRKHAWKLRCNPQRGSIGQRGCTPRSTSTLRRLLPIGSWISLQINNKTYYKPIITPTISSLQCAWVSPILAKYKLWKTALNYFLVTGRIRSFKISYLGKSFKWHRRKKGLHLKFGRSHISHVSLPKQIKWKKKNNKMRILMIASSQAIMAWYAGIIINWRPNNVYHGRGLRARYTMLLRKAGKVSTFR